MQNPFAEVNIPNIRKAFAYLREEPRRLEMGQWGLKIESTEPNEPPCGTVCCFAGGVILTCGEQNRVRFPENYRGLRRMQVLKPGSFHDQMSIADYACDLLEIPRYINIQDDLFHVKCWPSDWRAKYELARTKSEQVEILAEYVTWYLQKNGVELEDL